MGNSKFLAFGFFRKQKWLCLFVALAFLLNSISPAFAREGNYGKSGSLETYGKGALGGVILGLSLIVGYETGQWWGVAAAAASHTVSDLTGLVMYYYYYDTYGEEVFHIGNVEFSKGTVASMVAGTVTGAIVGYVGGLAAGSSSTAGEALGENVATETAESTAASTTEAATTSAVEGAATSATTAAATSAVTAAGTAAVTSTFSSILASVGRAILKALEQALKAIWTAIKAVAKAIWNATKAVGKALWNGIKAIGKMIVDMAKGLWKRVVNFAKSVWKLITHPFQTIKNAFQNLAKKINAIKAANNCNTLRAYLKLLTGTVKPVPNPYIRYGAAHQWYAAVVQLIGDLTINFSKMLLREIIKQSLDDGFEINVKIGGKKRTLLKVKGQDETVASIIADVSTMYFSAFITPAVRILLGKAFMVFKGHFALDNQGGYLDTRGGGYVNDTYTLDAENMDSKEYSDRVKNGQIDPNADVTVTSDGESKTVKASEVTNSLNGKNYVVTLKEDVVIDGKTIKAGEATVSATEFAALFKGEFIKTEIKVKVMSQDGKTVTGQFNAEEINTYVGKILTQSYSTAITVASHEYFQMRASGKVGDASQVTINSAKEGSSSKTVTAKELDAVFNDTYVALQMARKLENEFITIKDASGKDVTLKLSEVAKNSDGSIGKENKDGTFTVGLNDGKTVNLSMADYKDLCTKLYTNANAYAALKASEAYQNAAYSTGGFLSDVHGDPVSTKARSAFKAGWQVMKTLGLHPIVGAAVKVAALKIMDYRTHYGDDSDRVAENSKKMAIADFFGNLASAAVANWDWLNKQYAGTDKNPYRQEGMSYGETMLKETAMQSALLANELAWTYYCKQKGITPDALDEVKHLAAGVIVGGLVDAAFRRDPGTVENKDQVFVKDKDGDGSYRFISASEYEANKEKLELVELKDTDKVFRDDEGKAYYNPGDDAIKSKSLVQITVDKKNTPAETEKGKPTTYNITVNTTSMLKDPYVGGQLYGNGYRNKETGIHISAAQYASLSAEEKSKYDAESTITAAKRFTKAVAQDFNNHFIQAAARSSLYLYPMFTPGTGPAGFLAQQQVQDQWAQHIEAVAKSGSVIMPMVNRLAGNLRSYANYSAAESMSAAMTNSLLRQELRSYATFMTTNEKLNYLKTAEAINLKHNKETLENLKAFAREYGSHPGQLDSDIENLNKEIEASSNTEEIISKKEQLSKLEAMAVARDQVLKKAFSLGILTANEVYNNYPEAQARVYGKLMPAVIENLEKDVNASSAKIKALENAKGSMGLLSSVPILGAMIQAAVLSNLASSTGEMHGINDFIIGGVVDYNVNRTFDMYAPMSKGLKDATRATIEGATKYMSPEEKQAYLALMDDESGKPRYAEVTSDYSASVAGVYQGRETYANIQALNVNNIGKADVADELGMNQLLVVESEKIKAGTTIAEAETRLEEIKKQLSEKDITEDAAAELKKEGLELASFKAILEQRQSNPSIAAFTWIPGDENNTAGGRTKEGVVKLANELAAKRGMFSDYGLISRTTVDQFGRAVQTKYYQPEFIGGKWETGVQRDVITRYYYGPFGHAVSATVDYTQIKLPDAGDWPGMQDWNKNLGDLWKKLTEEFGAAGLTSKDLAEKLGIQLNGNESEEDLKNAFVNLMYSRAGEGDEAVNEINNKILGVATGMEKDICIDPQNVSMSFGDFIPPVMKVVYKKDAAGNYLTDSKGHRIVSEVIISKDTRQYKKLQEASDALTQGGSIPYAGADGKAYQVTMGKFTKEQAQGYVSTLKGKPELVKDIEKFAAEVWGQPVKLNFNTLWGTIIAYMALNPQADGRTWEQLSAAEKKDVLRGANGWRLLSYAAYKNAGVSQTIPDNASSRYFHAGSSADNVDINQIQTFFLPVIAGKEEHVSGPTIGTKITGPQTGPVTIGPNYTYDISVYSTGKGTTPYAGPSGRAVVYDVNSGPNQGLQGVNFMPANAGNNPNSQSTFYKAYTGVTVSEPVPEVKEVKPVDDGLVPKDADKTKSMDKSMEKLEKSDHEVGHADVEFPTNGPDDESLLAYSGKGLPFAIGAALGKKVAGVVVNKGTAQKLNDKEIEALRDRANDGDVAASNELIGQAKKGRTEAAYALEGIGWSDAEGSVAARNALQDPELANVYIKQARKGDSKAASLLHGFASFGNTAADEAMKDQALIGTFVNLAKTGDTKALEFLYGISSDDAVAANALKDNGLTGVFLKRTMAGDDNAASALLQLCNSGNIAAQNVMKDANMAKIFLEKITGGSGLSYFSLITLSMAGNLAASTAVKDPGLAAFYLKKAKEGDDKAVSALSNLAYNGNSVATNGLLDIAKNNNLEAIGTLYRLSVDKDDASARRMFMDLVAAGNAEASSRMREFSLRTIETVNSLHESSDDVRFASVNDSTARDLYGLMVFGEEEIYTSSFNGLFNRMSKRLSESKTSGAKLLESVGYNNFRTFIKEAASFGRLNDFLKTNDSNTNKQILEKFAQGIDKEEDMLSQAVTVADAMASIQDNSVLKVVESTVQKEYGRVVKEGNKEAMNIYGLLSKQKEYKAGDVNIPSQDLFNKQGRNIQQYFFYDDQDGASSYESFLSRYKDKSGWTIADKGDYVVIKASQGGKTIEMYANKPTSSEKGQTEIKNLFKEQGLSPQVVVHRGHSYHASETVSEIPSGARIVWMGSCGGYKQVSAVLEHAPQSSIISTKGTGTMRVNDPLLEMLNDELLNNNSVNWISFWQKAENKLGNQEDFHYYVAPHKNAGVQFIKSYNDLIKNQR